MPRPHNKDRTVTRSFRISERSLKALEDEAKRQNIGVSALLNQQLLAFADFDRYFRRLGLVKLSSSTFERLLQAASDDEIGRAGTETGADTPRSIISAKYGTLTLDSAIDFLNLMSEFSGQFEFGEVEKDGRRVLTVLHRLGAKGSRFFTNYLHSLFNGIGYNPKITASDHSITVEIPVKEIQTSVF